MLGQAQPQRQPAAADINVVHVDGHGVRVRTSGLENREPGQPVVVFEAGATNSLEAWDAVFSHLVGAAPLLAYDRAGLGESAWDGRTPTPRHVSSRLWSLFRQLGVAPPYVLVGHSWGGALVRYSAGYHPVEVVGLVYVDPGPVVTQSIDQELAPFHEIGAGRAGYAAFWASYASFFEQASPAVRAEFDVYRALMQREAADRDLPPVQDVPVVVILAAKPYPPLPGLPFDPHLHFQADLRHRIRVLQEWALASSRGTLVVTNHTSHAIPREAPDLIAWGVKRVLADVRSMAGWPR